MTQQHIKELFQSELGQHLHSIFSTSDDQVFVFSDQAIMHSKGKFKPDEKPLEDLTVLEWFQEWSGKDVEPTIRYVVARDNVKEPVDVFDREWVFNEKEFPKDAAVIFLSEYNGKTQVYGVFADSELGYFIRKDSELERKDKKYSRIIIDIPWNTRAFTPGFLQALLKDVIITNGEEGFLKKYAFKLNRFNTERFETDLAEVLDRVRREQYFLKNKF